MKFISEYKNREIAKILLEKIEKTLKNKWIIMEICGSQTHTILENGIDTLLPENLILVHGPGCPVCVTPIEIIDIAYNLSLREDVILCSYGDMLRVPGTYGSLLDAKAKGANIKMVYSSIDAIKIAISNPFKKVVFFAIGFETTTPMNAKAIEIAYEKNINNFYVLISQVRVPPAIEAILNSPYCEINGFLAPGHVCTVMGYKEYEPIAEKYKVPIVVTGFEPIDLLEGIYLLVKALEEKRYEVINQYKRSVKREGNLKAKEQIFKIFEIGDMKWRGIGVIPKSGFVLKKEYKKFDAINLINEKYFSKENEICIGAEILQGKKKPFDCPAYKKICTPENPLGALMVSNEGACAAYYKYGK
jgi:hydrogenase expression/formation protein HypD